MYGFDGDSFHGSAAAFREKLVIGTFFVNYRVSQ
jgi:hypothetical protein